MPNRLKIGFNPQDRFMMTLGNTLVVVTNDGSVFGADVVNRELQPVFQFGGAKIGFNPQDRFMMTLGNTLVVVTNDGSVFGADVLGSGTQRFLAPVQQFTGDQRIGFNPQDRFMLAVGNKLVVVTSDGNVFGSEIKSAPTGEWIGLKIDGTRKGQVIERQLQLVSEFSGAKIGYNAWDRFMMTLGNTLVVVTNDGDVFAADVAGDSLSPVRQINPLTLPARLQFRLRYFVEHDSTDSFLQGANDEVYLSAISTDSAAVLFGEDGKPVVQTTSSPVIGDVSSDAIRNPWRNTPYVLMEFDLLRPSDWPRSFVVTLLIVEHDNADLGACFAALEQEVGDTVKAAAKAAASTAAGAVAGAAIGSVIPGVGTAVGAAVGALAGAAYDEIIKVIAEGLGNEVFTPRPIKIEITDPRQIRQHPGIGTPQNIDINEHGGEYSLEYDWFLVE